MLVDLTRDEIEELFWLIGEPEDHYGDPNHPLISAKRKLEKAKDD